jgi:hypothetical protein
MADVGVSYGLVEHLSGIGENSISKYLSSVRSRQFTVSSLLRITSVLGLRLALVIDEELTRQMSAEWGSRDGRRVHTKRQVKLGTTTLRRMMKPIAAELGRRGGKSRMARLSAEQRRELGRRGAAMRWRKAATMRVRPIGDPAGSLRMWLDDEPPGAPE